MPVFLHKGQKQHSTEDANISRLVTKVRWVVESVNARVKQWKFFDKVVPNTLVPHIGDFLKIVCAIMNKFRPPLANMDPSTAVTARRMVEKAKEPNKVQIIVQENNLINKRKIYFKMDASNDELTDFPKLSVDYLRYITMGIYQVKQAPNYTHEHFTDEGHYDVMLCMDFPGLLHVKIQSRHSRNKTHSLWIQYKPNDDMDPIKGWYCTCKVGARVVGCCAHVSSVIWFLGCKRWENDDLTKRKSLTSHLKDASFIPECANDGESIEE
jgi:hypothetical protein